VLLSGGKLIAPRAVPSRIVILKEEPLPPEVGNGVMAAFPEECLVDSWAA